MALTYLTSNKVKVFPSAFRGTTSGDPESFLTTEGNFSDLSYGPTNFIQSYYYIKNDINGNECYFIVLGGYTFKVKTSDLPSSTPLYVGITIIKLYLFVVNKVHNMNY